MCLQLMTIKSGQEHWKKITKDQKDPKWATIVFANGFKNIIGFFVIGSMWSLPFWYIIYQIGYQNYLVQLIIIISSPSRIYCSAIALFYIQRYMLNIDK